MGKRTLRTLHFEMVARILRGRRNYHAEVGNALHAEMCVELACIFADEFAAKVPGFDRHKFLTACGIEEP